MDQATTANTYALYHDPCNDGFTAAWAARLALKDSAVYVPFTWGKGLGPNQNDDNPGFVPGSVLIFVDCCPNPTLLKKLEGADYDIQIIDHHRSAWLDHGSPECCTLRGKTTYHFNLDHSGAMLTWKAFHSGDAPPIIRYVEDRDLWRHVLPNTKEVHAFMNCFPHTFEAWDEIDDALTNGFDTFVDYGKVVLQREKMEVDALRVQGKHCKYVGGYLVPCVNAPKTFTSDVCARLLRDYPDAKFAVCYWDRGDGRREWGLRSRGDFDVSEIARLYDGGGHKTAAGFTTSYNDTLDLKDRGAGAIKLG